ncbi:GntR family transcriptional regulator [Tianweitania sp.]|uniref:GntR family transcriptional regulator n=1 Tax=Tianweitania sp. TaxID=2021634 RepID=UPI00289CFA2B|nr:GntR family transcriptional regulator [Tianweitania sp.]
MDLSFDAPSYELLSRGDTLAEQFYKQLARAISSGSYAPNQRLNIRRLADEIGASVTPVREAVLRLVADGVLRITDKNAIIVPERSETEIDEIFEIRRTLEGDMAVSAAPHFSDKDVAFLADTQEQFLTALDAGNYKEVLQLNSDFHFSIYTHASSPLRLEIVRMLWLRIGPTLCYMYPILHKGRSAHRRHEDIIEAARLRDPEALRTALLADLASSQHALRQYIRSRVAKPSRRSRATTSK